ncbi:adenylosuccinate lyase [Candidatus Parcubacteria bacterium]|nr:adenylosuccinate lyase [Candidatus Parcubacteria bacterium]
MEKEKRDIFKNISPGDYRYWNEDVAFYLSENGATKYKLLVEIALAKVLCRRGLCKESTVREIALACGRVTTAEIYEEEARIKHDIRALVNCITNKVSNEAKPFVHLGATSFDIIDTANAARYKDFIKTIFLPSLITLERVLIDITRRYANTGQIGRTHGQHAEPITFGFTMAEYVSRVGGCIVAIQERTSKLVGQFSGAVGAYNASSLLFDDPEEFEAEILAELGLEPASHSTQIVQPEPLLRLLQEIITLLGVLANLCDDMRHLQRSEIGEVGEAVSPKQVGSSTMPHKRNPIGFENGKSVWKFTMPRIITVLMDQISEHQRDLTNSASGKTYPEVFAYAAYMVKRLTGIMEKLVVDEENLKRNLASAQDSVAEPLYIILASLGHPDAHEKIRGLTTWVMQESELSLIEAAKQETELKPYFTRMTKRQKDILSGKFKYTGIAAQKAKKVADEWAKRFDIKEEKDEKA